jgi:two-component sensor histidine kinase
MILLVPSIIMTYFMHLIGLAVAYLIFAAAILFIALKESMSITFRKYSFLALLYIVALSLILFMGEHGAGITYLFGITVFALLILPEHAGKMTVFINMAICALHGAFIYFGIVEYPLRENYQVISWLLISGNSILLSTVAVIFIPMIFSGLQQTIWQQTELEKTLRSHQVELEGSLSEKETLLAEIHHRVKNNLAVISGMLQMQSIKEPSKEIQKKLIDSTLRIKSMANIHEQLYQSHSFSNISFDEGLQNLIETILRTMGTRSKIDTRFQLDPVKLNIKQAIPCSLIVNEVVTNAIKHAFNDQKNGEISVTLTKNEDHVLLEISDNGSGFKKKKGPNTSLGTELIDTLARQLQATYHYGSHPNGKGTLFSLKFENTSLSDKSLQ